MINRIITVMVCVIMLAGMMPVHGVEAQNQENEIPRFETAPCSFDLPPDVVEGEDIDCGYLVVAENSEHPDPEKTFKVAVAILHSTSSNPAPDPLVMINGGPGASSVDSFGTALLGSLGSVFLRERDIILIDQRGSKLSEPDLMCEEINVAEMEILPQYVTLAEENDRLNEAMLACYERFISEGINLAAFNSRENAADIDALRQAFGFEQYNLYGVSYGSLLALHVMRYHPEGLRSVILDAVVPPDIDTRTRTPMLAEKIFQLFFASCEADARCNSNYPNLETMFDSLVTELNQNPLTLSLTWPETGESVEMVLTGERLVSLVFNFLYETAFIPSLPGLIQDVESGNVSLLESWTQIAYLSLIDAISYGTHYAVMCSEDGDFQPEDVDTSGVRPYLADVFSASIAPYLDICPTWHPGDADATLDEPVVSDIPTLIFIGEFDPVIDSSWGVRVSDTLPNSYVYKFPGIGHGALFAESCPLQIFQAFMDNPDERPSDACIASMELAFEKPSSGVYEDPRFSVRIPGGWTQLPVDDNSYGYFSESESGAELYVLAVEASTLETGIDMAFQQIGLQPDADSLMSETTSLDDITWTYSMYLAGTDAVLVGGTMQDNIAYLHVVVINPAELEVLTGVLENILLTFQIH